MAKLRDKVEEFASIAKDLPENLQVVCFELLLTHHLETIRSHSKTAKTDAAPPPPDTGVSETLSGGADDDSQTVPEDISLTDIHVKARHFLKKYSLSVDDLNNLFYKEDGQILTLYEDLKTTRMSESQMRISLLQALQNSFGSGDFEAQVENVRAECADRKCYDNGNFASNFNKNKALFDFEKYSKDTKSLKISESGRQQLAEIIKELQ